MVSRLLCGLITGILLALYTKGLEMRWLIMMEDPYKLKYPPSFTTGSGDGKGLGIVSFGI
jgi:hypothetical protein